MGIFDKLLRPEERFEIRLDLLDNIIDDLNNNEELQKIFGEPVSRTLVVVAGNNDLRIEAAIGLTNEQENTFLDILDKVLAKNL